MNKAYPYQIQQLKSFGIKIKPNISNLQAQKLIDKHLKKKVELFIGDAEGGSFFKRWSEDD